MCTIVHIASVSTQRAPSECASGASAKLRVLRKLIAQSKGVCVKKRKANPRVGSDFEDFLREEGKLEEATAIAVKRLRYQNGRAAAVTGRRRVKSAQGAK